MGTTVGYGDLFPLTWFGKIIACFTALTGTLIIAFPVAIIGSKFAKVHAEMTEKKLKNKALMQGEKEKNKKNILNKITSKPILNEELDKINSKLSNIKLIIQKLDVLIEERNC